MDVGECWLSRNCGGTMSGACRCKRELKRVIEDGSRRKELWKLVFGGLSDSVSDERILFVLLFTSTEGSPLTGPFLFFSYFE